MNTEPRGNTLDKVTALIDEKHFDQALTLLEQEEEYTLLDKDGCLMKALCHFHLAHLNEAILEWRRVSLRDPQDVKSRDAILILEHLIELKKRRSELGQRLLLLSCLCGGCVLLGALGFWLQDYFIRTQPDRVPSLSLRIDDLSAMFDRNQQALKSDIDRLSSKMEEQRSNDPDPGTAVAALPKPSSAASSQHVEYLGQAVEFYHEEQFDQSIQNLKRIPVDIVEDDLFIQWLLLYLRNLKQKYNEPARWKAAISLIRNRHQVRIDKLMPSLPQHELSIMLDMDKSNALKK